jgi:cell division protein FtsL
MTLVLDILAGLGLAFACGLRPFLPTLVFGAIALGGVADEVKGTDLAFVGEPWFLLVITVLLVLSVLMHGYAAREPIASGLAGLGIGLGALLFAAVLASDGYTWWPGIVAGGAAVVFAQYATRAVLVGARERLAKEHAGGLPVYLEIVAGLAAAVAIFLPPVSLIYLAFLVRLLIARRRRDGEKYAGLRSLR